MAENIPAYVSERCREFADSVFIETHDGATFSYAEFADAVAGAGRVMDGTLSLAGKRFCISLPNVPEFLFLLFAGIARGGTAVNLNPSMSVDEFDYRFENASVDVMFTTPSLALKLKERLDQRGIRCAVVAAGEDPAEAVAAGFEVCELGAAPEGEAPELPELAEAQIAFFQYTGGTTGTIKAAMISHANVLASVGQMSGYLGARLREGEETFMVTFPFYHVFSIVFQVLTAMRFGSRIVLYPNNRDLPLMAELMQRVPFTVFVGVHTIYKWMLEHPVLSTSRFPQAKLFIAGAEPILPSTKERWRDGTGHLIVEGYGLTETSALVSMSALDEADNELDGIGNPLPDTEISLWDDDGNAIEGADEQGEVCVRGPQVVAAYWNNPEDNARTFVDGWLKTGDMAVRKPSGQYRIVGRKKDMINVSGFNVYPAEVELIVQAFDGVIDCAVAGVPDEKSGERVAAYVVAEPGLDDEALIAHCRERLSAYKVPVRVVRMREIPKSPVGKTLRRALAAHAE